MNSTEYASTARLSMNRVVAQASCLRASGRLEACSTIAAGFMVPMRAHFWRSRLSLNLAAAGVRPLHPNPLEI